MPNCNSDEENDLVNRARRLMAQFSDMEELIRLGAYKKGSDDLVDLAIKYHEPLEEFLRQKPDEKFSLEEAYQKLSEILDDK